MAVIQLGALKLKAAEDKLPCDLDVLVSTDPEMASEVISGSFGGKSLNQYIAAHEGCLGTRAANQAEIPFEVKILSNATDGLVQVNAYPNQDSIWYVLDAVPGAEIGYGFREEMTQERIAAGIAGNTLAQDMNKVAVKAGDVLTLKSGTVYSLSKGVTILEIQNEQFEQNPQADVLDLIILEPVKHDHAVGEWVDDGQAERGCLGKVDTFDADLYALNGRLTVDADEKTFRILIMTEGSAVIESGDEILHAEKNSAFFAPAKGEPFNITGNCRFIMVTLA